NAGLYDDIYMDLTFVDILERVGLDAPVDSFANAFANAGYTLWHANQSARYNILNGIKAPQSGDWHYNPHADDIDFQIESDFAGLMNPGMPQSASAICDKVGHIMNYGDGWYGGVFVSNMYSLAFISDNINHIIEDALKAIPQQSDFYKCIADVIQWHKKYPDDWHQTWFELQKKWSSDIGCPDGVFNAFDIDAKINAAYVVLGLLYGNGDFGKTIEIAARAGQDADCNPSTAGGVLGALIGYNKIPSYWKEGLAQAEDINFKYTTISLSKVYELSYKHALQMIKQNGGNEEGNNVNIKTQTPAAVRFEKCFEGLKPLHKFSLWKENATSLDFDFSGKAIVIKGEAVAKENKNNAVLKVGITVDGQSKTISMPADYRIRNNDIFWKYDLSQGKHTVNIKLLNPAQDYQLNVSEYIVYE
ncbi:MAG TPA: ADP-ribosylglycohydrolase family protein, partial [Chitinophagaceae bacterium]